MDVCFHGNANGDGYANRNLDRYADNASRYAGGHPYSNDHQHANGYAHQEADGNQYTHKHLHENADQHSYKYVYEDADKDSDLPAYGHAIAFGMRSSW